MKAVSIAVIGNGRWARALSVRLKHNQKQWRSRIRRAMLYQPPPDLPRLATFAEPSEIATYLLGLGRDVNAWYVHHRVLGQEAGVTAARLALVRASKTVIANGLRLLGPAAPDEM